MEPEWVDFDNSERGGQMVITEAAASCFVNTVAESRIGTLDLNTDKINQMLGLQDPSFAFDTNFLEQDIPMFAQKLGKDTALRLKLGFKDVAIQFAPNNGEPPHIVTNYKMHITFLDDATGQELLYDELPMLTTFNVDDREDIILPYILENKIDAENKYSRRTTPIRNSLDIGRDDYQPLLDSIQFSLNVLT